MLELLATDLAQVLIASLAVGAGVPSLFAFGIRALAYGHGQGPDGARHRYGLPTAIVCFALVVVIISLGIAIIVADGMGVTLRF